MYVKRRLAVPEAGSSRQAPHVPKTRAAWSSALTTTQLWSPGQDSVAQRARDSSPLPPRPTRPSRNRDVVIEERARVVDIETEVAAYASTELARTNAGITDEETLVEHGGPPESPKQLSPPARESCSFSASFST
jgi:hypothetical protein